MPKINLDHEYQPISAKDLIPAVSRESQLRWPKRRDSLTVGVQAAHFFKSQVRFAPGDTIPPSFRDKTAVAQGLVGLAEIVHEVAYGTLVKPQAPAFTARRLPMTEVIKNALDSTGLKCFMVYYLFWFKKSGILINRDFSFMVSDSFCHQSFSEYFTP